jgi:hypothetical protein
VFSVNDTTRQVRNCDDQRDVGNSGVVWRSLATVTVIVEIKHLLYHRMCSERFQSVVTLHTSNVLVHSSVAITVNHQKEG